MPNKKIANKSKHLLEQVAEVNQTNTISKLAWQRILIYWMLDADLCAFRRIERWKRGRENKKKKKKKDKTKKQMKNTMWLRARFSQLQIFMCYFRSVSTNVYCASKPADSWFTRDRIKERICAAAAAAPVMLNEIESHSETAPCKARSTFEMDEKHVKCNTLERITKIVNSIRTDDSLKPVCTVHVALLRSLCINCSKSSLSPKC